jgi:hypothetical protein
MKWLIFPILVLAFLLRLIYFNNPEYSEDINKDYLIARHAVVYKEDASTIILDDGNGRYINSPLYFSFLFALISIHDDIYFLGVINILLQTATIYCVYVIACLLFSTPAGILAAALFSMSSLSFDQSTFLWSPRVMQFFLYAAIACFTRGFLLKSKLYLSVGVVLFFIGSIIYPPTLILAPLLLFLFLYMKQTVSLHWGFFFMPIILYLLAYWQPLMHAFAHTSFPSFSSSLQSGIPFFVGVMWFLQVLSHQPLVHISILFCSMYAISTASKYEKLLFVFCLLTILCVITLSSSMASTFMSFQRYATAAYGIYIILASHAIWKTFSQLTITRIFLIPYICILIMFFSYPVSIPDLMRRLPEQKNTLFQKQHPFVPKIVEELHTMQNEYEYNNFQFFQVASYKGGKRYLIADAALYAPLEKTLGERLVHLTPLANLHFEPITKDDVILILCMNPKEACIQTFQKEHASFRIGKQLFEDIHAEIHIAQRITTQ